MQIRKFLLFSILATISISGYTQFKKGDKMAGASVGSVLYNSGSSDVSFPSFNGYTSKTTSYGLRIEPTLGWFISDKTAVGASLNINPTGEKVRYQDGGTTFQQDKNNSFNIGIGAFGRNYFKTDNEWMPFGQFGFNLGITTTNTEGFSYSSGPPTSKSTYDGKSSGGFFANASLQFGLTKMVGESTGLDFFAGYTYSYNKNTLKTVTSTDVGIDGDIDFTSSNEPTTKFTNHGFILGVGFQVFLKGKKK
jgi:hypothetical protein